MKVFFASLLFFVLLGCNSASPSAPATVTAPAPADAPFTTPGLDKYWYQGLAEISTYDLQQIRYGERHPGTATLIQVSEDFLTDEQVKNDDYTNDNSTGILKTNLVRRFTTGIYDYSVMTSVFTPVETADFPLTQKVTTSAQDWCGQSFTQLNYRGGSNYGYQLRSYFEKEGDVNGEVTPDFLEDEIFNRIRTEGANIPTGIFSVLPPTGYLLLMHKPHEAVEATATLEKELLTDAQGGMTSALTYVLDYPALPRRLAVTFEAAAPYRIVGWTETYPSRGQTLTTTATLKARKLDAYWGHNAVKDSTQRAELNL